MKILGIFLVTIALVTIVVTQFLFVFYRLKKVIFNKLLLQIYYGLLNSIAVYGIIGWGGLYNTSLDAFDRLQQRNFRRINLCMGIYAPCRYFIKIM